MKGDAKRMAALRGLSDKDGQHDARRINEVKRGRNGHRDIKRIQGYVCAAYLNRRRDELREGGVVCTTCDKSGRGCKACQYVLRVGAIERRREEAVRKEKEIQGREKDAREQREKYAAEAKITKETGRTITVEEYRRSKEQNGYNTDSVWEDKAFTAVDEVKNWGKLGAYIHNMIGEDIKFVSTESAERLRKLCHEYQDVWEAPTKPIKTEVKHKIELTDEAARIAQRYYKSGPKEEAIMRELVQEWLRTGVVERILDSEYRAPAMLVPKPDGTMRMVIDFRKLNKITRKNKYPMDDTEAVMLRLKGSKWFSKFDPSNGFYQIEVDEKSRKYTTLVTKDGMYQFVRMPMGLTNSPATFCQRDE